MNFGENKRAYQRRGHATMLAYSFRGVSVVHSSCKNGNEDGGGRKSDCERPLYWAGARRPKNEISHSKSFFAELTIRFHPGLKRIQTGKRPSPCNHRAKYAPLSNCKHCKPGSANVMAAVGRPPGEQQLKTPKHSKSHLANSALSVRPAQSQCLFELHRTNRTPRQPTDTPQRKRWIQEVIRTTWLKRFWEKPGSYERGRGKTGRGNSRREFG